MAPAERRQAIVEATLPLLLAHGRRTTTKQVAEAAGIAEGTIFRVFDSKDELLQATLEHGFDFGPFLDDLARVDRTQPLRPRLLAIVTILHTRFRGVFTLMAAMGLMGPPQDKRRIVDRRREATELMTDLIADQAALLTCSPADLIHRLRLLTFSATHPHISDGRPLTPQQIVDTVCDGLLISDQQGAPAC